MTADRNHTGGTMLRTLRSRISAARGGEGGQAMLVVVIVAALLASLAYGAQAMAGAQTPTVAANDEISFALQAAHAGANDYLTTLESAGAEFASYCSSYFCGSANLPPSTDVAFANCPYNSTSGSCPASASWVPVGSDSGGTAGYQYIVNSSGFSASSSASQDVTVWVTGRAGANGQWAYQTVEMSVLMGQNGFHEVLPTSTTTCSANEQQITAPPGATYAVFSVAGGGGGASSTTGGGYGQIVNGAIAVEPGWTFTASAGFQGGWGYTEFLGLAYGQGGPGGCGSMGMAGGNGGGEGINLLSTTAGGGGGASALCFGTEAQCANTDTYCTSLSSTTSPGCMVAVGAGGGGAGGGTSLVDIPGLFDTSVNGGQGGATSGGSANGANGQGLTIKLLGLCLLCLPGGTGGTAGSQGLTGNGAAGQSSLFALVGGGGGGGGGGFNGSGGGGGGAGQPGPTGIYSLIDVASGGGGGGQGAGTSSAEPFYWQTGSCTFSTSSHGGDGSVSVTFYGGTYCGGSETIGVTGVLEKISPIV